MRSWYCYVYTEGSIQAAQKELSGFGRAGRLRVMGKYISVRLVARPKTQQYRTF